MRRNDVLRRWLPVAAWAALISTFSTGWFSGERTSSLLLPLLAALLPRASHAQLVAIHHLVRKLAHFGEYFVFGTLLHRALRRPDRSTLHTAGAAIAMAAAWAIGDELHQGLVPGRVPSTIDWMIDASGAAAGQVLGVARSRTERRANRSSA